MEVKIKRSQLSQDFFGHVNLLRSGKYEYFVVTQDGHKVGRLYSCKGAVLANLKSKNEMDYRTFKNTKDIRDFPTAYIKGDRHLRVAFWEAFDSERANNAIG